MRFPCPRALSRTANAAEIARSHWLLSCRGVGDGYVQVRRSCSTEVCARRFSRFPARNVQPVRPGERSREEKRRGIYSRRLPRIGHRIIRGYRWPSIVQVDPRAIYTSVSRAGASDCAIDGGRRKAKTYELRIMVAD